MFDLLHMDLRRLRRDKAAWIVFAVFCGVLLFVCGMMALTSSEAFVEKMYSLGGQVSVTVNEQREMVQDAAETREMLAGGSHADFFYGTFCTGGGLSVFIVILSTLFVCEDFTSGFSKNIFSVHQRKTPYILSKSLTLLCATTGFLAAGILLCEVFIALFGLPLAASPLADYAKYILQAWLTVAAFAVQNVFFSVWTRNIALSMILSFVCAGGVVSMALGSAGRLFGLDLTRFTIAGAAAGDGLSIFSAAVCLVWIAVYAAFGTLALRRRDI